MKISIGWLGLAIALLVPCTDASNQAITAEFAPDSSFPGKNEFKNTTPSTGYCAAYPSKCIGTFSLEVPISFKSSGGISAGTAFTIRAPSTWKKLVVTHTDTKDEQEVFIRIASIGSRYTLGQSATSLTGIQDNAGAHSALWEGGNWAYSPSPCTSTSFGSVDTNDGFRFYWHVPENVGSCVKISSRSLPDISFSYIGFSYLLKTPNPLLMSSGTYTGSLNYTIGNGADFDFAGLPASDSALTLNFDLKVNHTLKVDIPPSGTKVVLEPAGGWQGWIEQGRKPARIYRDQTFFISASSRFKIMLECQHLDASGDCQLRDSNSNNQTVVETLVSLPNGLTFNDAPVRRARLRPGTGVGPIQPSRYVDKQTGTLHFEMSPEAIEELLNSDVSGVYHGNITVIFESEV